MIWWWSFFLTTTVVLSKAGIKLNMLKGFKLKVPS